MDLTVTINNNLFTIDAGPKDSVTLADALALLPSLPASGIAVAVDNRVVRRADWATTQISDGSSITVISAVCGG